MIYDRVSPRLDDAVKFEIIPNDDDCWRKFQKGILADLVKYTEFNLQIVISGKTHMLLLKNGYLTLCYKVIASNLDTAYNDK